MKYFLLLTLSVSAASRSHAAINIVFDYGGTSAADIATYGSTFTAAENFWESQLIGYRDTGFSAPTSILINVELGAIDGAGGILGSADPRLENLVAALSRRQRAI